MVTEQGASNFDTKSLMDLGAKLRRGSLGGLSEGLKHQNEGISRLFNQGSNKESEGTVGDQPTG